MNKKVCIHWNDCEKCNAGIEWGKLKKNVKNCFGKIDPECDKYQRFTTEEILEIERKDKETTILLRRVMVDKISSCCDAPIDESRVIKSGKYKGHGGRYCSKCGKCIYFV